MGERNDFDKQREDKIDKMKSDIQKKSEVEAKESSPAQGKKNDCGCSRRRKR